MLYDFSELNEKLQNGVVSEDLRKVFQMIESLEGISRADNLANLEYYQKFGLTKSMFQRSRRYRKHFLIKILNELDYSKFNWNKIDGDSILNFLFVNGLRSELLDKYKIHPTELSSTIHLKLLQNNIIQDEFEYQSVMQQNDLKGNCLQKHLVHAREAAHNLITSKMLLTNAVRGAYAISIERKYNNREDAKNALNQFVYRSGIEDLNKFLVDLWLIEFHKIHNPIDIEKLSNDFIKEKVIIGSKEYRFTNFENNDHFLASKVAQSLRQDPLVKKFIKEITENRQRSTVLNTFLVANKVHFASYGSNMFIYEHGSIEKTAENMYKKLKLYKNIGSLPCHKIIVDAFKSFMIIVQIRYHHKSKSHDGIGHFGGFANEIKRLQIKENGYFVRKNSDETVDYLFKCLKEPVFQKLELKYDDKLEVFDKKENLLKYLEEFNDIVYQNDKLFLITNEDTVKKRTARIAANKKFNNLLSKDDQDLLKTILQKDISILQEVYLKENNGSISKAGVNGLFKPDSYKYDISTVFGLAVSNQDFKTLSQKRENLNKNLKEVTTVETLSLYELLQRFGYYGEAGNQVSLISEQDDYKSYAYKYPHEYFAGVIKTMTEVINKVVAMYKREFTNNVDNSETKQLQLWIIGHVIAAAQNEILDGKLAKLTKQNIVEPNNESNKELNNFMQTFFGPTISGADFDNIQLISSRVHLSVTIKNLENTFLDSGKLCLAEFKNNEHPLFDDKNLTVYKSLEYESESEAGLSLSYLIRSYGDTYPIKKILELVIGESPIIISGVTYVTIDYFIKRSKDLISKVTIKKMIGTKVYQIKIECKPEIKKVLKESFAKIEISVNEVEDCLIIPRTASNTDNYLVDSLNTYISMCGFSTDEIDIKEGFLFYIENLLSSVYPNNTQIKLERENSFFSDNAESLASQMPALELQ